MSSRQLKQAKGNRSIGIAQASPTLKVPPEQLSRAIAKLAAPPPTIRASPMCRRAWPVLVTLTALLGLSVFRSWEPKPMLGALAKAVASSNEIAASDPSYDAIFYATTSGTPRIERIERRRYDRLREVLGTEGLAAGPLGPGPGGE